MKALLDVNALVALGFVHHEFHDRVALWVKRAAPAILTCSITELGFIRVLSQAASYQFSLADARSLLAQLKRNEVYPFAFVSDDHDVSRLPRWVKTARQTTDGHLLELARSQGAFLATLDERIPGAFLIK